MSLPIPDLQTLVRFEFKMRRALLYSARNRSAGSGAVAAVGARGLGTVPSSLPAAGSTLLRGGSSGRPTVLAPVGPLPLMSLRQFVAATPGYAMRRHLGISNDSKVQSALRRIVHRAAVGQHRLRSSRTTSVQADGAAGQTVTGATSSGSSSNSRSGSGTAAGQVGDSTAAVDSALWMFAPQPFDPDPETGVRELLPFDVKRVSEPKTEPSHGGDSAGTATDSGATQDTAVDAGDYSASFPVESVKEDRSYRVDGRISASSYASSSTATTTTSSDVGGGGGGATRGVPPEADIVFFTSPTSRKRAGILRDYYGALARHPDAAGTGVYTAGRDYDRQWYDSVVSRPQLEELVPPSSQTYRSEATSAAASTPSQQQHQQQWQRPSSTSASRTSPSSPSSASPSSSLKSGVLPGAGMGSGMTTVGHTPQTDRAVQHAQQEQGRRQRQGAQGHAAIVDVAAAGRASAAAAGSSEAGQVTAASAGGGKQKAKQKKAAAVGSGGGGRREGKSSRQSQQQALMQPPMDVDAELERWLGEPPEQRLDDEAAVASDLATWGMHPKHHEGDMGHHTAYDAHWYSMVAGRPVLDELSQVDRKA